MGWRRCEWPCVTYELKYGNQKAARGSKPLKWRARPKEGQVELAQFDRLDVENHEGH